MSRDLDTLPQSPAVSALVRRIVFKLDGALTFRGHPALSHCERAGWFTLGEASAQLDRIALLPGMAQHEERARRDLLELYDVFGPPVIFAGHTEPQETCLVCAASPALEDAADSFDSQTAAAEAAHHAQLDARESDGDATGCMP